MEPLFSTENRKAIEALLFSACEPLKLKEIAACAECSESTARDILMELTDFYADRGFHLEEIAGGWQFITDERTYPYLERLYQPKIHRLSKAAMETLAIIAYCQPVTRGEIENIRGVNADSIVSNLYEKGFLKEIGRKDTPGKPVLYGTSDKFLELLGINSLHDLPQVDMGRAVRREEDEA
ncbi:MAG: SMC-Scp complex subunit ScpB [Firmicutes bacterium]|nr:SMC-Scp complex subunit ScpB [Bacillota bacterium]